MPSPLPGDAPALRTRMIAFSRPIAFDTIRSWVRVRVRVRVRVKVRVSPNLGSRPLPQAAPYGSATLREAATEGQRALWCRGLVQRASALRESITAALTVREG